MIVLNPNSVLCMLLTCSFLIFFCYINLFLNILKFIITINHLFDLLSMYKWITLGWIFGLSSEPADKRLDPNYLLISEDAAQKIYKLR